MVPLSVKAVQLPISDVMRPFSLIEVAFFLLVWFVIFVIVVIKRFAKLHKKNLSNQPAPPGELQ